MNLIDVDKIIPIDSHIHYIKKYQGSAIFMDLRGKINRYDIKFSIEYKPIGDPDIKITFMEHPDFPLTAVLSKMKKKIHELDHSGILSASHQNN